MMRRRRWLSLLSTGCTLAVAATASLALVEREASACGGTFCDAGPQTMPVDQTGENILFVLDGSEVEAHIQIQYDPETEADKFAWVIPVVALPEFSVGTENLFTNLLNGSVPSYGSQTSFEPCGDVDNGAGDDAAGTFGSSGDGGAGDGDGDGDGPDVVFQDTVGAYEIAVLDGGTVQGVMDWLAMNGYQQDPASEPILDEYLQEGHLFVALKLTTGVDVDSIHPIVLKYTGTEPCVPIRLTRIAASEDMEIRTFFLGDARTVPSNYKHVLVNDAMVDWFNPGANYKDLITQAVDADMANGQAFVTEYAGTSNVVNQFGLWDNSWDAAPFAGLADPVTVVDTLEAQGLVACGGASCDYQHPLIQPLLNEFIPVPTGVDEGAFYDCLACYQGQIDMMAWDGAAFGAALNERIIVPGRHAVDLLQQNPYLTRMYTTISPGEMTADPMFMENPDLDDVASQRVAQQLVTCEGGSWWTLPSGRQVYLPAGQNTWPAWPGEMPWEEDVAQGTPTGPMQSLVNNADQIQKIIDDWNDQFDAPAPPGPGGEGGGTDGGGSANGESSGCACDVGSGSAPAGLAFTGLALLGGLALRRRR